MGKRRRNTAKTGDKALYKKAAQAREAAASQSRKNDDDDDDMYNAVDQFHNQRDEGFIKLHGGNDEHDEPEGEKDSDNEQEAVMDLGVGGSSSEDDDDDDDDSDSEESLQQAGSTKKRQPTPASSSSESSDDDDEEDDEVEDVRDWGRKKSAYYHGDTADLELGQDEEDAFLEEKAAKEVVAARLEEMEEDDFMLSDDEDEQDDGKQDQQKQKKQETRLSSMRDVSKLSTKDRRKLLEKQHPGLLQILAHFSQSVKGFQTRTNLATKALFPAGENTNSNEKDDAGTAESIGCTPMGKKYLLTKALLQASTALNLAIFLLLKSEESSSSSSNDEGDGLMKGASLVQFHPVMKRLQELNVLQQKLKGKIEDSVEGLSEQMDNLIKAAELMEKMATEEDDNDDNMRGAAADDHNNDDDRNYDTSNGEEDSHVPTKDDKHAASASSSSDDNDDDESSVDEQAVARSALHDARFGLRPNEVVQDKKTAVEVTGIRRRGAAPSDLGDDGEGDNMNATRYLASAINTIEQRAASKKKKARMTSSTEEIVDHREADDDLRRGLEMMEAELGKDSDEDGGVDGNDLNGPADDIDSDDEDAGFYAKMAKKSKAKKEHKKRLYAVAPKFPRMEVEIEGERPIGRTIMKNRGLVAHKNKLNRNPRVKKREQYRKALIRRKGSVREVRTDEGHKYGGEETGIKSRISRSRKLGTN